MKILIAEEAACGAPALRFVLEGMGHDVVDVSDGIDALEAIAVAHPDAAIIDLEIPHLDGYAIARTVRRVCGSHTPYLVAYSGFASSWQKLLAFAAGFHQHMTKPASRYELAAILDVAPRCEPGPDAARETGD